MSVSRLSRWAAADEGAEGAARALAVLGSEAEQLLLRSADGHLCALHLAGAWIASEEGPSPAEHVAETDAPVPEAAGGLSSSDFANTVESVDETHFNLDVSTLRAVLESGGEAVTEVALAPLDEGARLGAAAGVFGYLGLREGDVLLRAGEEPVQDVNDLVRFFGSLDEEPATLHVLRNERELAIRYAAGRARDAPP